MHKEMRRKDRLLTDEESRAILEKGQYGILATVNAEGEPYGVPISYVLMNGAIYIHSAAQGEKLDNLARNPMVSFTVVGFAEPVGGQPGLSTYYESCIVFGKAREVTDVKEKIDSLKALTLKYLPEFMNVYEVEIKKEKITKVFAIPLDRVTGKSKKKPA
ncbi:Pyridoxamine 5'-phosphate oxidase-related FMN-binding protein [uncultured delta proteobacterium]|uniref:Pyridoxamine 5'-phosphate oxidase-related FMN-binding protein n=1 Tax=uncultured delta proteobacterium TaxID=34034 RepID=A0A212IT33_9DELT|nr:Pyridoxamine 5'-phosphate oxidase-related FMN-binding protein [uncultured delta proteobacterium]